MKPGKFAFRIARAGLVEQNPQTEDALFRSCLDCNTDRCRRPLQKKLQKHVDNRNDVLNGLGCPLQWDIQDFMPNLDDNVVNLSVLAGLCTTVVSLFRLARIVGSRACNN